MEMQSEYNLKLTERYADVDDNFKQVLSDLCAEIDKFGTDFLFAVRTLSKMPYELAMVVVSNLKYKQNQYVGVLNTLYYDEFKRDIKKREENKKSKFQNRLICQKSLKYETFAIERLLTIGEVENLIEIFIEDDKLHFTKEEVVSGIETGNKKLNILFKAHKFLSQKKNAEINDHIMKKMSKVWLLLTMKDIVEYKEKKRLNI